MNKTAILSFIIDEVALKCRNVSSNMRKRIHYMLKEKQITLRKYDQRALILNGWVKLSRRDLETPKVKEINKGVSNCMVDAQEQLDRMMTINKELRFGFINFKPTSSIEFESVQSLLINQHNYQSYSKCSFNIVRCLSLYNISTDQIKSILIRCKRIKRIIIHDSSLESIDFSSLKIKEFFFKDVSFKESVSLPRKIDELHLFACSSPNLIKAQRVNEIEFNNGDNDLKDFKELAETLKEVKVAKMNESLIECLTYLPSTIRKIDIAGSWDKFDNLDQIVKHFPYLIELRGQTPIKTQEKSKLRVIEPIMSQTKEKFKLRPRKITVTSDNASQLNNHAELFEKMEYVCVKASEFDFSVLPSEIKRIYILNELNEESKILNSLKKEP